MKVINPSSEDLEDPGPLGALSLRRARHCCASLSLSAQPLSRRRARIPYISVPEQGGKSEPFFSQGPPLRSNRRMTNRVILRVCVWP